MLQLDSGGDTWEIIWIASIVGAIAGLIAELLISRGAGKDTGAIELPRSITGRFVDFGSFAAIFVGGLAGLIAVLALVPGEEKVVATVTVTEVELKQVIAVAAIAGLSSASFLTLVQDRFLAMAKNERLDAALEGLTGALTELKKQTDAAADVADDEGGGADTIESVVRDAQLTVPPDAMNVLRDSGLIEVTDDGILLGPANSRRRTLLIAPWTESQEENQIHRAVEAKQRSLSATAKQLSNQIDVMLESTRRARPSV